MCILFTPKDKAHETSLYTEKPSKSVPNYFGFNPFHTVSHSICLPCF